MNIPASPMSGGQTVAGKVSWFGGKNDAETGVNKTASGAPTSVPGIAIYNRATLGGYWKVTAANGRSAILKQTDLGPAPFTGRKIDVTYSALGRLGYNEGNFPTDSTFKATYLGQNPAAAAQAAQNVSPLPVPGAPAVAATISKQLNIPALQAAEHKVALNRILLPGLGGGADNPLKLVMGTAAPNPANFEKTVTTPGKPAVGGSVSPAGGVPAGAPVAPAPSAVGGRMAPAPDKITIPSALPPAVAQAKTALERASGHPVSLPELEREVNAGTHGHYAVAVAPGHVVASYNHPSGQRAIVQEGAGKLKHIASTLPAGHRFVGGEVLGAPLRQQG